MGRFVTVSVGGLGTFGAGPVGGVERESRALPVRPPGPAEQAPEHGKPPGRHRGNGRRSHQRAFEGSGGAGAHSPAFGGVRSSVGADAGAGVAVHVDLQQVGVGVGLQLPRCVSARQQERRSCRVSALRCSWPFSFRGPVVFTHCRLIWCAAARVFCLRLLSFYLVRCHLVLFCLLVSRGTENNGMAAPCRHAVRLCELSSR